MPYIPISLSYTLYLVLISKLQYANTLNTQNVVANLPAHRANSERPINSTDCEVVMEKQVVLATGMFVKLSARNGATSVSRTEGELWHQCHPRTQTANICCPCAVCSGDRKLCKAQSPKKQIPWEKRKEASVKTVKNSFAAQSCSLFVFFP